MNGLIVMKPSALYNGAPFCDAYHGWRMAKHIYVLRRSLFVCRNNESGSVRWSMVRAQGSPFEADERRRIPGSEQQNKGKELGNQIERASRHGYQPNGGHVEPQ